MRTIKEIIIHCSATPAGRNFTVEDIDRWHHEKGWDGCGYHYVIHLDGSVHVGRAVSKQGAHCVGHNKNSIGICYIGGLQSGSGKPMDTRTEAQKDALRRLVAELRAKYPKATVHGHCEFAAKACPCFDVKKEFGDGVDGGPGMAGTAAPWTEWPERLRLGRRGRNGMMLEALRRNRRERWL